MRWLTACRQRCTAPPFWSLPQKSCRSGGSWYLAMCTAWFFSSSTPSFFAAEMGTTGTPSSASMRLMSTAPPLPRSSSIMFSATTVGMPVSSSCMVRYRLRSMLVASTILMMARGRSFNTKSRLTSSSLE